MRRNLKKILITVLVVWVLGLPTVQAEEAHMLLRWKNGGNLPGQLQESSAGTIRWASPYFLDDLVVDIDVLNSVVFPKTPNPATETFRVRTVSGDVWIADLIGSDDNTFLFSSKRHGQFRVKRAAVRSLEHRNHSNLLFDGSQLTNWKSPTTKKDIDDLIPLVLHESSYNWHQDNWHQDNEGHPRTSRNRAKLFHAFKWPKHFEIDLALAFTGHPPNFTFAFGKDLYQALRLEVWSDKLVAVQGTLLQPVLTIQPEQHELHLRLTYDESVGVLRVFDFTGNLLLELEGVKPTVKESGVYIQNRGKGLTVRALKVYRQPTAEPTSQQVDFSKPRVYMMNGQIVQGELFVQKDNTYVLDTDGTRQDIDPQQVSRIVQPGIPSAALDQSVTLKYPDEVVLRGKVTEINSERVILQTAFADDPVTCSLAGASRLHFDTKHETNGTIQNTDMLFHATGNLRGRVLFTENRGILSTQWESLGALKPVRLANNRAAHIRRFLQPTSKASGHFDTAQFPHALHLQTGETFPCQITDYDGKTISFQSSFISAQHLDSATIKAFEFSDRTSVPSIDNIHTTNRRHSITLTLTEGENLPQNHKIKVFEISKDGKKKAITGDFNLIKSKDGAMLLIRNNKGPGKAPNPDWMELPNPDWMELPNPDWMEFPTALHKPKTNKLDKELERALTVPRFNRDHPPNHILVANTDDMMRGKFLGLNGQMLQFDSKLRKFSVPIDRVARIVDVSDNTLQSSALGKDESDKQEPLLLKAESRKFPKAIQSEVRVTLTDGSMLIFEPLEVQEGKLIGRSSIYGEVSVPLSSIEYLYLGEKAKSFKAAFEKWNIRPAKEPAYGDNP
ncbi:hypothetical protein F4054_15845 [Candidatus Poribacteria bacterium]|nr:hypothetical protein [Candidatus Poribacteria bacterium]MYG07399.1 hypothetical protein [Candidatus Poribacteria bacterium]MYK23715.1 hypothetical protein [Candidatus Poribacteria bacterium]